MFFWKTSEGGGGSFPIQKITLQILLVSKRYVLANPKKFIANLRILNEFSGKKRNVISKKGEGSRPFGSFPKKHPYLGIRSPLIGNVYI